MRPQPWNVRTTKVAAASQRAAPGRRSARSSRASEGGADHRTDRAAESGRAGDERVLAGGHVRKPESTLRVRARRRVADPRDVVADVHELNLHASRLLPGRIDDRPLDPRHRHELQLKVHAQAFLPDAERDGGGAAGDRGAGIEDRGIARCLVVGSALALGNGHAVQERGRRLLSRRGCLRAERGRCLLQPLGDGAARAADPWRGGDDVLALRESVDAVHAPVVGRVVTRLLERADAALDRIAQDSNLGSRHGLSVLVEHRSGEHAAARDLERDRQSLPVLELNGRAGPPRAGHPLPVTDVEMPRLAGRQRKAARRKGGEGVSAPVVGRHRPSADRVAGQRHAGVPRRCSGPQHDDGTGNARRAAGNVLGRRRHVANRSVSLSAWRRGLASSTALPGMGAAGHDQEQCEERRKQPGEKGGGSGHRFACLT